MQRKTPWILAAVLAAGGGAALAQQAPVDLSAERRGLMRQQLQAVRAIQPVAQGNGDPRSVQQQAESLVTTGQRKLTLFPPGSDRDDDRARPEIWTDRAEFDRAGANLIANARRLAAASSAGDSAAFVEAFQATSAACT
ncbi:MAG TPA: cytochrome c, partial [Geminicoccaceae bacterium]|nr:cytochrome c [Geminicoccaceae bacterium]